MNVSLVLRAVTRTCLPLLVCVTSVACRSKAPPEPESKPVELAKEPVLPATPSAAPLASAANVAPAQPLTAAPGAIPGGDPAAGKFSLAEAVDGVAGKGKLIADIATDLGKIECELFDDKAPVTVANFIGLARGLRPWKTPDGQWVKRNAYDGTTFHRVIKGFMIQGGDPAGNGSGEPGYVIPDELWQGATHNRRGQLCMANRGPNTNGMQFFITDAGAPHLDRSYTIFGQCGPDSLIEKLASVPVQGDRSVTPSKISKVTVRRGQLSPAK